MSVAVSVAPADRGEQAMRWARALERAQLAQVEITAIDDLGTFQVTSASHHGVVYFSDGIHCTCKAAEVHDPVCLHRAAIRNHQAAEKPCTACGGSGWEHFSIWDWRNGCAADLYSIRCGCQDTEESEPPAPAAGPSPERIAELQARLDAGIEAIGVAVRKLEAEGYFETVSMAA